MIFIVQDLTWVCLEKRKLGTFKHWTSELDTYLSSCQCRQGLTSHFLESVLSFLGSEALTDIFNPLLNIYQWRKCEDLR